MASKDVLDQLTQLFAKDQPVVVWHDPEGEYADQVEEIASQLDGVELVCEEPNSAFALKQLLNDDLTGRNILLYRQRSREVVADDWLADVESYAAGFEADTVSLAMRDLNCVDTPAMRNAVSRYRRLLAKKTVAKRVRGFGMRFERPQQLEVALLAATLGRGVEADRTTVVVAYLAGLAAGEADAMSKAVATAGLSGVLAELVASAVGYKGDPFDADAVVSHVLLGSLANELGAQGMVGMDGLYSKEHVLLCHSIVRQWAASRWRDDLYEACLSVQEKCNLRMRFDALGVAAICSADTFPGLTESLLESLLSSVATGSVPSELGDLVRSRRSMLWGDLYVDYLDALEQVAQMSLFQQGHAVDGFAGHSAKALWEGYTDSYCAMDRGYRLFCRAYRRAVKSPRGDLDTALKQAADRVENLYRSWYLEGLGGAWSDAIRRDLSRQGYVDGVDRQEHFYMSEVEGSSIHGKRLYVVVSDALRYEVAMELADRLEATTKGQVDRRAMQSTLPSKTSTGMAALLPTSRGYRMDADGNVTIGGMPTATTVDRQEVLRTASQGAVAVRYAELLNMSNDERKSLVGNASVVYVYHNSIDAKGDSAATEGEVFEACDDAVDEIQHLVSDILVRGLKASDVVITADHGFIYNRRDLSSTDVLKSTEVRGELGYVGRRFVVAKAPASSDTFMSVGMARMGAPELVGFSPRGVVRIAKPGPGQLYVHGGASLQEMCVPVLRFHNYRAGTKGYVEVANVGATLLDSVHKVTSSTFKVRLLQDASVGGKVVESQLEVSLEDSMGNRISDVATVAANRTGTDGTQRTLEARLTLKPNISRCEAMLVVRNVTTGERIIYEKYDVNVAFAASDDFGW